MPSAVVHGAVPLLFLLALRRLDARKVWILWPLTFLPDLDYFLGFHRATFTNVFVLVPFVALLVWDWRAGRRDRAQWWGIALVYLASHLVMDMMTGGVVPFYPVSDYTVCYYANVLVYTQTNTLAPDYGVCSHGGIPQVTPVYGWLTDNDAAMVAFLVPAALAVAGWQLWRARKAAKASSAPDSR
ncbi:MAG: LexA-binding, inner rane-associated putative hydrolase [Thermoplasmata archaeon]|jgi:hypothetical protein|nr:LexA-binding, inner rane-associated putative hydrolase [Thermoplasmata archaeon]